MGTTWGAVLLNKRRGLRRGAGAVIVVAYVSLIGAGMFGANSERHPPDGSFSDADVRGLFKPLEPAPANAAGDLGAAPQTEFTQVRITHIPSINQGDKIPHPYFGGCTNCHLIRGGPRAGSQAKSPLGALYESFSKNIFKVGPPIFAGVERPHPPAGRCIKCHDIVVRVRVDESILRWE